MAIREGTFVLYTIQHKTGDVWEFSNYDNIASAAYDEAYEGWDATGARGFLSLDKARRAIKKVQKANPKRRFRLVQMFLVRKTLLVNDHE